MSISIYIVEKGIDKYVKNIYLSTRLKLGHRIIRDVHRRGRYVAEPGSSILHSITVRASVSESLKSKPRRVCFKFGLTQ